MNPIETTLHIPAEHLNPYPALEPSNFKGEIAGKSVIITGASYGLGAAAARAFAAAGAKEVFVLGRTKSRLDSTAAAIRASYPDTTVTTRVLDVTSQADIDSFFGSLATSPDILVNNAAALESILPFKKLDLAEFAKVYDTNVVGLARITQAYLHHRDTHPSSSSATTKPPAVVLNLGSAAGFTVPSPTIPAYMSSKTAVTRLTELLASQVPAAEARFISVHPGAVFTTPMGERTGLKGMLPETDENLSAHWLVWASTERAAFLNGRFAWVAWDVEKLAAKKDEILERNLLRTAIY